MKDILSHTQLLLYENVSFVPSYVNSSQKEGGKALISRYAISVKEG